MEDKIIVSRVPSLPAPNRFAADKAALPHADKQTSLNQNSVFGTTVRYAGLPPRSISITT